MLADVNQRRKFLINFKHKPKHKLIINLVQGVFLNFESPGFALMFILVMKGLIYKLNRTFTSPFIYEHYTHEAQFQVEF